MASPSPEPSLPSLPPTTLWSHVLINVLRQSLDGPINRALARDDFTDIYTISTISDEDIDSLKSPQLEGGVTLLTPFSRGHLTLLKIFREYVIHWRQEHTGIPNFYAFTAEGFNDFRLGTYAAARIQGPRPSLSASQRENTSAEDFRRGIKRDKSQYTVFCDDKQWDSWRRSTIATACSHNCAEIFDPGYCPASTEEHAVFVEKQKFMYSVFEHVIETDMVKFLVCQYKDDFNTHTIFQALNEYATTSTQATIDSEALLSYLTSAKLDSR